MEERGVKQEIEEIEEIEGVGEIESEEGMRGERELKKEKEIWKKFLQIHNNFLSIFDSNLFAKFVFF